jgi:hypothetical protein
VLEGLSKIRPGDRVAAVELTDADTSTDYDAEKLAEWAAWAQAPADTDISQESGAAKPLLPVDNK